jgi:exonuclease SbcC
MSNTSPHGSIWRKWDLHFHTPSSFDYADKSITNQALVDGLIAAGIEVVAVTDHHVIDASRIRDMQRLAGGNLVVLPGIEFRSELGGSNSVHFIGIFPENCPIEDIWTTLSGKLGLTATEIAKRGGNDSVYCDFVDTSEIVHELGGLISVHAGSKSNTLEGLKSANLISRKVKTDLVMECIDLLELGDLKDIKVYQDIVFPSLKYEIPLIGCSDNHDIGIYPVDGFFWLKGDRCFESLRQAVFEPRARVRLGENRPLQPFLTVSDIVIGFPNDAKLRSNGIEHPFCFRGHHDFTVSPYLTCIVGGRGTGKSTLLNMIHEKLFPSENQFFAENRIVSSEECGIERSVKIDGDENQIEIEFLQQNEIEQFAAAPERFTSAVFSRLKKLDAKDELESIEVGVGKMSTSIRRQAKLIKESYTLKDDIVRLRKDLHTNKRLVDSFENPEYKKIAVGLGDLSKEAQKLRGGSERLDKFVDAIRSEIDLHDGREGADATVFDAALQTAKTKITAALDETDADAEIANGKVRIASVDKATQLLKNQLGAFLEEKGLSPENLADVKRASEMIAELGEKIPDLEERLATVKEEIAEFDTRSDFVERYENAVRELLDPINKILSDQSSEVKPIRLEYSFDLTGADEAIYEVLAEVISDTDGRKIRIDHVRTALGNRSFFPMPSKQELVDSVITDGKTGQALRDYFGVDRNYDLLILRILERSVDVQSYRRIRVYYDEKPIEASSFGQRCTAAIVVLVLLGNTPIIIDEPEAHLDSSLIAKFLVNLIKEKKQQRQIIFATHNANFVINGDAELVHVLEMNSDSRTTVTGTTIENLEHRERLLALEGGRAAFLQRENRYGI